MLYAANILTHQLSRHLPHSALVLVAAQIAVHFMNLVSHVCLMPNVLGAVARNLAWFQN